MDASESERNEMIAGPKVSRRWTTGQLAVNTFDRFCLKQGWVFVETPQQRDFGRDGLVDFAREGELTGHAIAVQIKGGRSWRRKVGYGITASRRTRAFWMRSTVPVFGIVWDPEDDSLHWIALTALLRQDGLNVPLTLGTSQTLRDSDGLDRFLDSVERETTGPTVLLNLGSDEEHEQVDAVYGCYAFGRSDPRFMVVLRRSMFGLQDPAFRAAIEALDVCSLNMDHIIDTKWMSMEVRQLLRKYLRWTVDEAIELLAAVEEDSGFERGSFGQVIYWLLVGDDPRGDSFVKLVEKAMLTAADRGRDDAAGWGLVLLVYWAGDEGSKRLDWLVSQCPRLADLPMYSDIRQILSEHNRIEIG